MLKDLQIQTVFDDNRHDMTDNHPDFQERAMVEDDFIVAAREIERLAVAELKAKFDEIYNAHRSIGGYHILEIIPAKGTTK